MKKLVCFIALTLLAVILCTGCVKTDAEKYVSQLRTDVMCSETGEVMAYVYCEEREIPLSADGEVGETTPCLVVKITNSSAFSGTFAIRVEFDGKSYSASPSFRTDHVLRAEIPVEALPEGDVTVVLVGDEEKAFTAKSLKPSTTADYRVALNTAFADFCPSASGFEGEIFVRLLCEEGKAFWYVGFVCEDKISSYLLSDTGKEIVASRISENVG